MIYYKTNFSSLKIFRQFDGFNLNVKLNSSETRALRVWIGVHLYVGEKSDQVLRFLVMAKRGELGCRQFYDSGGSEISYVDNAIIVVLKPYSHPPYIL